MFGFDTRRLYPRLMGKISRFGKRYEERLEAAEARAREDAEREANMSASEKITRAAENIDTYLKVAEQLSTALAKAIDRRRGDSLWLESWSVESVARVDARCYDITFTLHDRTLRYRVLEERLAEATQTVQQFHDWINAIAARIVELEGKGRPSMQDARKPATASGSWLRGAITNQPVTRSSDASGWLEVNVTSSTAASQQSTPARDPEEIYEELASLGLISLDAYTPEEEAAAIESLRQALGEQ